jgi:hypothetical protein
MFAMLGRRLAEGVPLGVPLGVTRLSPKKRYCWLNLRGMSGRAVPEAAEPSGNCLAWNTSFCGQDKG